jgi:hypothetical protein
LRHFEPIKTLIYLKPSSDQRRKLALLSHGNRTIPCRDKGCDCMNWNEGVNARELNIHLNVTTNKTSMVTTTPHANRVCSWDGGRDAKSSR